MAEGLQDYPAVPVHEGIADGGIDQPVNRGKQWKVRVCVITVPKNPHKIA